MEKRKLNVIIPNGDPSSFHQLIRGNDNLAKFRCVRTALQPGVSYNGGMIDKVTEHGDQGPSSARVEILV
jgi:hypothetical protein